jgi:hypothetical protein
MGFFQIVPCVKSEVCDSKRAREERALAAEKRIKALRAQCEQSLSQ